MTNTTKLFDLAELTEASYADFTNVNASTSSDNIKAKLVDARNGGSFTDAQATEFAKHWKVVHHQADTVGGFSGTLFQRIDNDPISGYQAGQLVYAVRGTAGSSDLTTDIGDISIDGLALDQIVDMYNDWKRITAGVGNVYNAARLVTDTALTIARALVPPLATIAYDAALAVQGYIIDKPLGLVRKIEFASSDSVFGVSDSRAHGDVSINVNQLTDITGHSLGGHLAAAFTRLFPGMGEALTINGAGFPTGLIPGLGLLAGLNIQNLFSELGGASQFNAGVIHNVFGDKNPEIVTMDQILGLKQQGSHDALFIEQPTVTGNTLGHGKSQMTDSLAVANLFIRLDASLATKTPAGALSTLNALMEKGSNQAAQSLEKLVEGLSEIILGYKPTIAVDNRDDLYTVINNLNDATTFLSLIGKVTLTAPPTSASEARDDFGAFLSLYYLTPFALKTDGSAAAIAALGAAQPDLEDKWQADNALTPEQIRNGEANFSDQYLADRAAMLSWIEKRNEKDNHDIVLDAD